jgi:hypothetical protein
MDISPESEDWLQALTSPMIVDGIEVPPDSDLFGTEGLLQTPAADEVGEEPCQVDEVGIQADEKLRPDMVQSAPVNIIESLVNDLSVEDLVDDHFVGLEDVELSVSPANPINRQMKNMKFKISKDVEFSRKIFRNVC